MSQALYQAARKANKPLPDRKERVKERSRLDTRRRTGAHWKEFVLNFKTVIGWALLLPLALFSLVTFTELFFRASREGGLLGSAEFCWFGLGALAWTVIFARWRADFMIAYVFGHEWSHILAAKICGAVVYDYQITRNGGWVDTNKSNTFISLAPYLLPFYTIGVLILYGIAGLFVNLESIQHIPLGSYALPFSSLKSLSFLIGFTWWFHLSYTLRTLRIEQSDLKRNGAFFSGWLIMVCNLYIVAAMLICASPAVTWMDGWSSMQEAAGWTFGTVAEVVAALTVSAWHALSETVATLQDWHVH